MDTKDAKQPANKAELLEHIQLSRAALAELLAPLEPAQLLRPSSTGWSIKDHLAHIAAWELWAAGQLLRQPGSQGAQIEAAIAQGKDETEINDLIQRQNAGLSLDEVQRAYQQAHLQMLQALERLSDADLDSPYQAFVSGREINPPDLPVRDVIINNTYDHYDQHTKYIRAEHADLA
jgi:uncharacterized protein (TIGR03083 family)